MVHFKGIFLINLLIAASNCFAQNAAIYTGSGVISGSQITVRQIIGQSTPIGASSNSAYKLNSGAIYPIFSFATIKLLSPNGGENWRVGETDTIKWIAPGVAKIKIEYTTNNGSTWLIVRDTISAAFGKYLWTIPNTVSGLCKVRISDALNPVVSESSDGVFLISNSCPGIPFINYSGKTYNTVQIGVQCWLKENLDIGTMLDSSQNSANNAVIEKYCFRNNPDNCVTLGGYYQWDEAMKYSSGAGATGICPPGWHIPSRNDFTSLESFVHGNGNSLKATGQGTGGGIGNNNSGFSALLAGGRGNGFFFDLNYTNMWTSERIDSFNSSLFYLNSTDTLISTRSISKDYGFSIRCIKDTAQTVGSIRIIAPNGGENWKAAEIDTIKWTSSGISKLKIEYTTNNGNSWQLIVDSVSAAAGRYSWILPNTPSAQCKVRITDAANSAIGDTSDNVFSIVPPPFVCGTSTVSYSGKTYNTIQIGPQCWLKENLDVGKMIPGSQFQINNSIIEKFCYNNDTANCRVYGGLYEWSEAMQYSIQSRAQGICPQGWHLPDTSDYRLLAAMVNNSGNALKAKNQGSGAGAGTNASGFSALLAGFNQGTFFNLTKNARMWSSTQNTPFANNISLYDTNDVIRFHFGDKMDGYSVRCLRDTNIGGAYLIKPNGNENWRVGETDTIQWTSSGVAKLKIEYTTNNGTNWLSVRDTVTAAIGIFAWVVPNTPSSQCRVRISDANNAAVRDSSDAVFTISLPSSITVLSPNGGENWKAGEVDTIKWTSSGVAKVKIEYSTNNGAAWLLVRDTLTAAGGKYPWTVPNTPSTNCKVKISDAGNASLFDVSDAVFAIYTPPSLSITAPNGGEIWMTGTTDTVRWSAYNIPKVRLEYTTNNGTNWLLIRDTLLGSVQKFAWVIPNTPSAQCKVRATDVTFPSRSDMSDTVFTISTAPSVTVLSPNGGEQWRAGRAQTIKWASGGISKVNLSYSTDNGTAWIKIADSLTAAAGMYSWLVPNTPSEFCIVKIVSTLNSSLNDFSDSEFSILPLKTVTLLAPNGGDTLRWNASYRVRWSSQNVSSVRIRVKYGAATVNVTDSVPAQPGQYDWMVPEITTSNAKLIITDRGDSLAADSSDAFFAIAEPVKFLRLNSPNGAEMWFTEKTRNIAWQTNLNDSLTITYTADNGATWKPVAQNVPSAAGVYPWLVPEDYSMQCWVRIQSTRWLLADTSDAPFAIFPSAAIATNTNAIAFDTVYIDSVKNLSVQLTSSGMGTLRIDSVTSLKKEFALQVTGTLLKPDSSGNLNIIFAPKAQRLYTDTIFIWHNAPGRKTAIAVSGTGLYKPFITLAPESKKDWLASGKRNISWTFINVLSVKLEYSSNGGASWSLIETGIPAAQAAYQWTVSTDTTRNALLRASSVIDAKVYSLSEPFTIFTYPSQVPVSFNYEFTNTTSITGYRMFGIPGNNDLPAKDIFSGEALYDWKLVWDNGDSVNYQVKYDGSATFNFKPGRAFWTLSKNPVTLAKQVAPVLFDTMNMFTIPLHKGWNLIANPYEKEIPWSRVQYYNQLDTNLVLHYWDGTWKRPTLFEPYKGYYFLNVPMLGGLKIPYNPYPALQKISLLNYYSGALNISLWADGKEQSSVMIHYNPASSGGYDKYDYFSPPSDFEESGIWMRNNGLETPYKNLFIDSRASAEAGNSYDVIVKNISSSAVDLRRSIENAKLPQEISVVLFDVNNAKPIDLRKTESIRIQPANGSRMFKLLVGSQEYVAEQIRSLTPGSVLLHQNYPNPFNPVTNIAFSLPSAAYTELTIYDILGTEVQKVHSGQLDAGYHEFTAGSAAMSAGVYFYRLRAGDKILTAKMVLLK